jgi:lipopolysaccharide assembly outer membrane protein LptD (OstA)
LFSASCSSRLHVFVRLLLASLTFAIAGHVVLAQQTNPVDRKVTNPMTDTPNVNPLNPDQSVPRPTARGGGVQGVSTDQITVDATKQSASGPENARIVVYEGNVDVRIGTYRLQADKVTVYEAENRVLAEGSVVFDQGEVQRITGSRADWNYRTKTGYRRV